MNTRQAKLISRSVVAGAVALMTLLAGGASAETWWALREGEHGPSDEAPPAGPRVTVPWRAADGLAVSVETDGVALEIRKTRGGRFLMVSWPEAPLAGRVGEPALPVVRRLVVVPEGATVWLEVAEGPATTIDLAAAGYDAPVIPRQPAVPMDAGPLEATPFRYDRSAYQVDDALPGRRATIRELGVIRGHGLHQVEVRPVAYNPLRHELTVWERLDVRIEFGGGRPAPNCGRLPRLSGMLLNPPPATGPFGPGSGNYLIVVGEQYSGMQPLCEFAAAKTAQGFKVMTYVVPPGTSRYTIKDYIESLWGTPDAPDYILLVGDTDTIPEWTGGGAKRAATDLPYVCMDPGDDWYPDIAIGRFSVRSEDHLRAMVDKTLMVADRSYPDPNYVQRAVFMATSDMSSGAEETHDWIIENIMEPAEYEVTKIYARLGGGREHVRNAFNRGQLLATYFGHSGTTGWSSPPFNQSDVQALTNAGKYPAPITSYSCNVGRYTEYECFGETWVRVADRGAAAVIFPSTFIYYTDPPWHEASNLDKFHYQSMIVDGIRELSPAWQAALVLLVDFYGPDEPACRDYSEMYNLMGDPSLVVPEGTYFRLRIDPVSQSVCAPPTEQAEYVIEVEQHGDFDEPVTLSAAGLPPGASVSFSANGLVPPFTSVMTVSNLIPGSPGDYELEVTGTAPSMQRTITVALHLSDGVPGKVVLSSPPDGATDVPRQPTMIWEPAAQAVEYHLQIATDPQFTDVVYAVMTAETSHTLDILLEPDTQHYWHVQARNGCGESEYSPAFGFVTVEQQDYFTEQFEDQFDLENFSVVFVPDGSSDYYAMCGCEIEALPTDPAGGTPLYLGDDRYENVRLSGNATVTLYGRTYGDFYVGSNGYLTFGAGDTDYSETLEEHFALPRVAALYDDLNPIHGGTISWKQLEDRAVVTYENVPEYGMSNSNTFQFELFFEGKIRISWLGIDVTDCIAGLSAGNGLPPDFLESDLSAAGMCCRGDFNSDGRIDLADLAILLAHYPTASGAVYEQGDFDEDGDIDLSDLAGLLAVYGTECP